MALEQLEQPLVAERRHLHRLTERGPPLPLGQGREHADIDDDRGRLMERADEVLALRQVDRGLAPDRGVDLGDERRRDVHDRDAAQVRRGEEAGGVAERPATDGDDRLVALDPEPRQLARRGLEDRQALGRLALGKHHGRDGPAGRGEAGGQALTGGRPRPGLRHEDRPPRLQPTQGLLDGRSPRCRHPG